MSEHEDVQALAAESHAAALSVVAMLLGDFERSERYKVELLTRAETAERRVADNNRGWAARLVEVGRERMAAFDRYSRELGRYGEICEQNKSDVADLLARLAQAEERATTAETDLQRYADLLEERGTRLAAAQAALNSVLGEPPVTNEPKPDMHATALAAQAGAEEGE